MPRIAIPIPTSIDLPYNQRSWHTYADAVTRSGGDPVAIDITLPLSDILALAATCHGLLLPGSPADVEPDLYGEPRQPECGPRDLARETADRLLLEDAEKHRKPVLAICFGLQFLNVWRGGSLLQDLSPLPVNHSAGASIAIAHTALIAPQSLLGQLTDPVEAPLSGDFRRLPINTSHHQAVAAPGEGLRITARCPDDGVIEALELDPDPPMFHVEHPDPTPAMFHVEHSNPQNPDPNPNPDPDPDPHPDPEMFHVEHLHPWFVLGVQWHPERSFDISPTSRSLFARLISEATHNHSTT